MAILVTGAAGQIGSELVPILRHAHGHESVVISVLPNTTINDSLASGPIEYLDATNRAALEAVFHRYQFTEVYHLVGILSARGEQDPDLAWNTNMLSLKHILDLAVQYRTKVFWPSSIAAFGPSTPRQLTPQQTVLEPTTMYGVSKVAGELLCNYYFIKYGLDVRSLRFPGLISWKTEPGGGTTDYAVAMFYEALRSKQYTCFVRPETVLPMMYMEDALQAVDQLMKAPARVITVRTSYNIASLAFSAKNLAAEIKRKIPEFACSFQPDYRQQIADSWPQTVDDQVARHDWGWNPKFDLTKMVDEMLMRLKEKFARTD